MKYLAVAFVLVALLPFHAKAETCVGIYPPTKIWVENMVNDSESIFLGSIIVIQNQGKREELRFKVDKQLKGNFSGTAYSGDLGPNFALKANETRIFFVGHDGNILDCSDYRYYFTDAGVEAEIRAIMSGT